MEFGDENEPPPNSYRVKLYQLESQGIWLDRGTGFVTCSSLAVCLDCISLRLYFTANIVQLQADPSIFILRDEDRALMLQSRIVLDDVYERQGGKSGDISRLTSLTHFHSQRV
jgi:hypothetical protein